MDRKAEADGPLVYPLSSQCPLCLCGESLFLAAFTACIALSPNSPECYVNRALVSVMRKEYDSARRDLETALDKGGSKPHPTIPGKAPSVRG
jgi:hypothetical protein